MSVPHNRTGLLITQSSMYHTSSQSKNKSEVATYRTAPSCRNHSPCLSQPIKTIPHLHPPRSSVYKFILWKIATPRTTKIMMHHSHRHSYNNKTPRPAQSKQGQSEIEPIKTSCSSTCERLSAQTQAHASKHRSTMCTREIIFYNVCRHLGDEMIHCSIKKNRRRPCGIKLFKDVEREGICDVCSRYNPHRPVNLPRYRGPSNQDGRDCNSPQSN